MPKKNPIPIRTQKIIKDARILSLVKTDMRLEDALTRGRELSEGNDNKIAVVIITFNPLATIISSRGVFEKKYEAVIRTDISDEAVAFDGDYVVERVKTYRLIYSKIAHHPLFYIARDILANMLKSSQHTTSRHAIQSYILELTEEDVITAGVVYTEFVPHEEVTGIQDKQ